MKKAQDLQPLVILFICPNQDFLHGQGDEYTTYLLIPGHKLSRIQKMDEDGYTGTWSFRMSRDEEAFILIDDPSEAWQTAVIGSLTDCQVLKYPHVCMSCRRKGIRS
jgi:hypothetical protein